MSYLSRIRADVEKPSDEQPAKGAKGAFDPFDGSPSVHLAGIPDSIIDGLTRLNGMARPRLKRTEAWEPVLADIQRLVREGWVTQALGLGWSDLDLFGAVSDPNGDAAADGFAVKLGGRKVKALCSTFATVTDDAGVRFYIYRGNNEGARLLWDLGRGR